METRAAIAGYLCAKKPKGIKAPKRYVTAQHIGNMSLYTLFKLQQQVKLVTK